ncbi:uncharacterized protein LOC141586621 [Silene latifolia]|uniref:uncharacterized protein LOC141586621 n=1 Tax=Silene latifolia TaxID=37657 RepID=UPI003D77088D
MATSLVDYVKNIWPFSYLIVDDLKLSDRIVRRLSLPDCTKQFIFAINEPSNGATVYILCAQNLSSRSARDVEYLIREVRPDAVIALVGHNILSDIQEHELIESRDAVVPTSAFGVLTRCFMDKSNKDRYENLAGNLVLKEIFDVGFYGHFFVAKRLAEDIGSSFSVLESPFVKSDGDEVDSSSETTTASNILQTLALKSASLVPHNFGPVVCHSRRFLIANDVQSQMVKLVCPLLASSLTKLSPAGSPVESDSYLHESRCNYCPPSFAQSVYPLLMDLHDIFADIPSMGRALAYAQKMFLDVCKGDNINTDLLSEVYTFQIAVEGLRVALNNAGRLPMHKLGNLRSTNINFHELSVEEKSHCLLAQALRSRAKQSKAVVAVVDAGSLAGLRKFWNTPIPEEVKNIVEELVVSEGSVVDGDGEKKWRVSAKPVVAVGAGATAVLGASSLSKVVPVSTVVKVVTMNVPTSLKLFLTHTYKVTGFVLSKILGPSKVMAPGFAGSGAKVSSIFKAAASAEKIRVVTHSVIASAEKTSFSAMRTALYEIMRRRRVQPIGFMPLATFGFSIATCGGLLVCGDGIECAAESFPEAPSIACLGRGIQNLQQTSLAAKRSCGHKIQTAIESLMYRLKNVKVK